MGIFKDKLKGPKYDYLYECSTCRERIEYVIELPSHLAFHNVGDPLRGKCKGMLILIEKKEREQ